MPKVSIASYQVPNHHVDERTCPACDRLFPTIHGKNVHLAQSLKCKWYKKGKLPDFRYRGSDDEDSDDEGPRSELGDEAPNADFGDVHHQPAEDPDEPGIQETEEYISMPSSSKHTLDAEPPRKRQRPDEPICVKDVHPTAGKVIETNEEIKKHWQPRTDNDGSANMFHPFVSELDWRVAEWFVEDGPGISALDRLLSIKGVCAPFITCSS